MCLQKRFFGRYKIKRWHKKDIQPWLVRRFSWKLQFSVLVRLTDRSCAEHPETKSTTIKTSLGADLYCKQWIWYAVNRFYTIIGLQGWNLIYRQSCIHSHAPVTPTCSSKYLQQIVNVLLEKNRYWLRSGACKTIFFKIIRYL